MKVFDPPHPPTPAPTPPPPSVVGGVVTSIVESITKNFNFLVFPVKTISDAIFHIFNGTLVDSASWAAPFETDMVQSFGSLMSPDPNAYADISNSGLKVAAGIAVALFVLRLAIYNWNRMIGDEDDAMHVLGDWLTAGVLAVVAGPLLDLVNKIGWWIMGVTIGNAQSLAASFVGGITGGLSTLFDLTVGTVANTSTFVVPIIDIALIIASLLAVAGLVVAFASGHAAMFVLAAIGPTVMVTGVIPKMRWIRGMWLQALVIIGFLPVLASALFKAGILASAGFGGGFVQELFHILWLFGMVGALLSLSGVLAKFTIGAAGEAFGKMVQVGKGIIQTAMMAGAGLAAGGPAGGVAGATAGVGAETSGVTAAATTTGAGAVAGTGASTGGGLMAASDHLQNAQQSLQKADQAALFGMDKLAAHYQRQAQQSQIAAREADVNQRIASQTSSTPLANPNFGYSPSVNQTLSNHYQGPNAADIFGNGLAEVSPMFHHPEKSMSDLVTGYTDDMIKIVDTWNASPGSFTNNRAGLMSAAGVSTDFQTLWT